MSFVDPRKPPHAGLVEKPAIVRIDQKTYISDWRYAARVANVECETLPTTESDVPQTKREQEEQQFLGGMSQSVEQTIIYPIGPIPIDPRPDLASSPEHPDRTDDPEFPYATDGGITIPGEMPNIFVVVESDPKSSTGIAPVPLEHSPVIPVAPRREKTLSDYYGVFGPPRKR